MNLLRNGILMRKLAPTGNRSDRESRIPTRSFSRVHTTLKFAADARIRVALDLKVLASRVTLAMDKAKGPGVSPGTFHPL